MQKCNTDITNKSLENIAELKYFGMTVKKIKATFTKKLRAE
jgi:hypothetical protein